MVYATLLFLVFLMEAVAGVLAYMYNTSIQGELERNLNNTMINWYHFDADKTAAIDKLQREFTCCGAVSFEDWRYSRWLKEAKEKNTTQSINKAPDSCCKTESEGCAVSDHPSNINYNGCLTALSNYVKEHLIILGGVGIGICFLQIFGIVFACCLAKRIKDYKYKEVQVQYAYAR
ncbi:unnamed protein product [Owenia fusiformis]|nr:unnamed protein product [Owenia fusiformis]